MGFTKRKFIELAFEEIGFADYQFDIQPEQQEKALIRMDSMVKTWEAKGIRIGYPVPDGPDESSIDDETNVVASAVEAIYLNLAVRIGQTVGKQLSPDTRKLAREALEALDVKRAPLLRMRFRDGLPTGAGNRLSNGDRYRNFVAREQSETTTEVESIEDV